MLCISKVLSSCSAFATFQSKDIEIPKDTQFYKMFVEVFLFIKWMVNVEHSEHFLLFLMFAHMTEPKAAQDHEISFSKKI